MITTGFGKFQVHYGSTDLTLSASTVSGASASTLLHISVLPYQGSVDYPSQGNKIMHAVGNTASCHAAFPCYITKLLQIPHDAAFIRFEKSIR